MSTLEFRNLTCEVKTIEVFDHNEMRSKRVEVMAFVFECREEGVLTCTSGIMSEHFCVPEKLKEYFEVGSKRTLWCTWEESLPFERCPVAVTFEGVLLALK